MHAPAGPAYIAPLPRDNLHVCALAVNQSAATTAASPAEYRCPGEEHPIARAVHYGRLAAYYPACRQCPHRHDTGPLSPRQVKRLAEAHRPAPRPLFHGDHVSGVYLNDLGAAAVRKLGSAFGVFLSGGEVVLAGDARPLSPELVAAAAEGLRWSGCGVADVGPASAPCTEFAAGHLGAAGAVLIGNPAGRPETVGVRFWRRTVPLAAGPDMEEIHRLFESRLDRPTRRFGPSRRVQVEDAYLAQFAADYHGLRPLRFVMHSTCAPVVGYVRKLLRPTACELLPCLVLPRLGPEVAQSGAHFGAAIADDGQSLRLWDERGREAASGGAPSSDALAALTRLLVLLSRSDRPLSAALDTPPPAP